MKRQIKEETVNESDLLWQTQGTVLLKSSQSKWR